MKFLLQQTFRIIAYSDSLRKMIRTAQLVPFIGFFTVLILYFYNNYMHILACKGMVRIVAPAERDVSVRGQCFHIYAIIWAALIPTKRSKRMVKFVEAYLMSRSEAARRLETLPAEWMQCGASEVEIHFLTAELAYDIGLHEVACKSFMKVAALEPSRLHQVSTGLRAAFSAGLSSRRWEATAFFCCYYNLTSHESIANAEENATSLESHLEIGTLYAMSRLLDQIKWAKIPDNTCSKAVFFLSSTHALGHAILDPYYFLSLVRHTDRDIFFVGPRKSEYRPGSATCLKILEEYGTYLEVTDDYLLNSSWMSLRNVTVGNVTFYFENYWSLIRTMVKRHEKLDDPFLHNDWHFQLPVKLSEKGKRFCFENGISHENPWVVIHARHSSYHRLSQQAFRDADIETYRDGIEHLISRGYTVIRIGDSHMPQLSSFQRESYFELPFMDGYDTDLDPYFVANAHFMIGCQSGPCAYARVFGIPILSVNAVLHYTLVPAAMEMACFKRYYRGTGADGTQQKISEIEALKLGVAHFDYSHHFDEAGISVRSASPDEVTSAIKDMIDWLDNPELEKTREQQAFEEALKSTHRYVKESDKLRVPGANYIAATLPNYRTSPSVAESRSRDSRSG
jgi:putative glycosyltransferase (TIGR04372 family)